MRMSLGIQLSNGHGSHSNGFIVSIAFGSVTIRGYNIPACSHVAQILSDWYSGSKWNKVSLRIGGTTKATFVNQRLLVQCLIVVLLLIFKQ